MAVEREHQSFRLQRTAFVAFFPVVPVASGAANVSYGLAKYWPGQSILVQPSMVAQGSDHEGMQILSFGKAASSRLVKIMGLPVIIRRIVEQLEQVDPELVILEGASWVVYHLLLLRKMRSRGLSMPVIYHGHNVEYLLRRQKQGRIVGRITYWAEKRLLREATFATAVSAVDQSHFRQLYGVDARILPNGVDLEWLGAVRPAAIETLRKRHGLGDHSVLFMGNHHYFPNRQAIEFLVRKVFPRVVEKLPDAQLLVAGSKEVPYDEPWLLNLGVLPRDQLPVVLGAVQVSTAPIFSGSGTRLKILESMAAGVPVVSTTKGMEGLELQPGGQIFVADDAQGFAEHLIISLQHPGSVRKQMTAAFEWVRDTCGWPVLVEQLTKNIERELPDTSESLTSVSLSKKR